MSTLPAFLRIRVVNRITGAEITSDLPHLQTTKIVVQAMQPGNPASSALGSFTVNLFPPGSPGYETAKAVYDQLDRYLRLEFYISYHPGPSAPMGKLYFAGPITGIDKSYGSNSAFTLTGASDLQWAHTSAPFPGEVMAGHGTTGSLQQAEDFLGTNTLAFGDAFNPYTAGNYTSTSIPAHTSGAWSAFTDDGLSVIGSTTGSGAALISKTDSFTGDPLLTRYVEVAGRLQPSSNTSNAGLMGVGISASSADATNSALGDVQAKWNAATSSWDLTGNILVYNASALTSATFANVLTNVGDPEGFVPLTIGLLAQGPGATQTFYLTVNGQVAGSLVATSPFAGHGFPFLFFGTATTGFAQCNSAYVVNMIRNSGTSGAALPFVAGTLGTPAHSLPIGAASAPTHLEVWTQVATRENWYWRYTPKPYVSGSANLGTVDLTNDPGTDRSTSIIFDRDTGNLVELQLSDNADRFASATVGNGQAGTDSGGLGSWRDVTAMQTYGVIQDQTLATMPSDFATLRKTSYWAMQNKLAVGIGGAKTITVLRDAQTADKWRELDKITVNDPWMGVNRLVARVIGYTFDEGQPTQTLTLDQFAENDPNQMVSAKRFQTSVFKALSQFKNR